MSSCNELEILIFRLIKDIMCVDDGWLEKILLSCKENWKSMKNQ